MEGGGPGSLDSGVGVGSKAMRTHCSGAGVEQIGSRMLRTRGCLASSGTQRIGWASSAKNPQNGGLPSSKSSSVQYTQHMIRDQG
jgi:hypothetical protein